MDFKKRKKPVLYFGIILFIAGLADIKCKGLFYQALPKSIQTSLDRFSL
ncbi:hypothetical protein [Pseudogracilibacillus sp. SO30301A]